MNYYLLLKLNRLIKNPRAKLLAIAGLFLLNKRYLNVFIDPVFACNLRCVMCYFSDPSFNTNRGPALTREEIAGIAGAFFKNAMRVQIGCGAEPSLYKYNPDIIRLAKKVGVGYVSFTSNVNLLNKSAIEELLQAGLDELIVSMHGVTKETYERMMKKASFEKFHQVLHDIALLKKQYPGFKLRINYTINPENLPELRFFFDVMGDYGIDILQLRPIRRLGDTEYADFDLTPFEQEYHMIIRKLNEECKARNIVCLSSGDLKGKENNQGVAVVDYSYCYISPGHIGDHDFRLGVESWRSYSKRTGFLSSLWDALKKDIKPDPQKSEAHVNYDINL